MAGARQRGPHRGRTRASRPEPGGKAQSGQGLGESMSLYTAGTTLRLARLGEVWDA